MAELGPESFTLLVGPDWDFLHYNFNRQIQTGTRHPAFPGPVSRLNFLPFHVFVLKKKDPENSLLPPPPPRFSGFTPPGLVLHVCLVYGIPMQSLLFSVYIHCTCEAGSMHWAE